MKSTKPIHCVDSHLNSDLNSDKLLDPDLQSDAKEVWEIPIFHLNSDGRLIWIPGACVNWQTWHCTCYCFSPSSCLSTGSRSRIQIPCDHPSDFRPEFRSGSRWVFRHMTEALWIHYGSENASSCESKCLFKESAPKGKSHSPSIFLQMSRFTLSIRALQLPSPDSNPLVACEITARLILFREDFQ